MHWRECLRIGVNHHLLHVGHCDSPEAHAETLLPLLADQRFAVLDLWIPASSASVRREVAACRDSGKAIVYNLGSRRGQPSPQPASLDAAVWQRSLARLRQFGSLFGGFYAQRSCRKLKCSAKSKAVIVAAKC